MVRHVVHAKTLLSF